MTENVGSRSPCLEHDVFENLAYIDPGAGSLFIQAAIASVVAVPFFLRHQIRRFIDLIRRSR